MAPFSEDQLRAFAALSEASLRAQVRVFVVGGIVRDLFCKQETQNQDIDFLVAGDAIEFSTLLAQEIGGSVKKFPDFVTAKIVSPQKFPSIRELDFASARTETYPVPGALPCVSLSSVEEDLKRRDFTINAMALPVEALWNAMHADLVTHLKPAVLDYFHGLDDLKEKKIRVLHDLSFIDDPTRVFRAARYTVRINGTLAAETHELLNDAIARDALTTISEHRKVNEIKKILGEEKWINALELLQSWAVLRHIEVTAGVPQEKFLSNLRTFSALNLKREKVDRLAVFLALAAVMGPAHSTAPVFSKIGLSQKRIQEFSLVREQTSSSNPQKSALTRVSDAAVIVGSLLSENSIWKDLLHERDLIEGA